ncbi:MAG: hypothetical protein JWM05_677 [Acidimicrobiales bacterium]|nr:hypothetical protein [Acidimicrobiales bacterium]
MTTRVCPSCGSQFLAAVERCVDCDQELVDAPDDATLEAAGLGDHDPDDQIAYELDEWANEAKVALDGMLNQRAIAHVWEAGTLVIRAVDEAATDALVEEIESTQLPTLDPDADQVIYEVEGFDDAMRADLEAALMAEEIPHGWDEDRNLVVLEVDEAKVEPILDRIDMEDELTAGEVESAGEDPAAGDGDGLAAQDLMSAMFVAVDKLMKDPTDRDDLRSLDAARTRAGGLAVPYGFSAAVWNGIVSSADELHDLLSEDDVDVDAAKDAARALRETLHQYV